MGGFPVRPFIENWLKSNPNRTVTLIEIHQELPQIQERSIQDVMRRLAAETDSGVTVVHRGHSWHYTPKEVELPPQVDAELEAEPVKAKRISHEGHDHEATPAGRMACRAATREADGGTPQPTFKWVGWSRQASGDRLPLVRDREGVIYRCHPV